MSLFRKTHTFLKTPRDEKLLFFHCLFAFLLIKMWLIFINYKAIQKKLSVLKSENSTNTLHLKRLYKQLHLANKYIPWKTKCIDKSLAAKYICNKLGIPSKLHLGVKSQQNKFMAHAWLEIKGSIFVGHTETQYKSISSF